LLRVDEEKNETDVGAGFTSLWTPLCREKAACRVRLALLMEQRKADKNEATRHTKEQHHASIFMLLECN
jgi:hypothetical protein